MSGECNICGHEGCVEANHILEIAVILDNGGGSKLQVYDEASNIYYVHFYNGLEDQLADDIFALIEGGDPIRDGWDGNEIEQEIEYNYEDERNGGYTWYQGRADKMVEKYLRLEIEDVWGCNGHALYEALSTRTNASTN